MKYFSTSPLSVLPRAIEEAAEDIRNVLVSGFVVRPVRKLHSFRYDHEPLDLIQSLP
ncbi:MAG: hypothetical protein ACP5CD_03680 [Thermovirgaceae bacterium]